MKRWLQRWRQYRYRFLPWLIFNLKDRSVRTVTELDTDVNVSDEQFHQFLFNFLTSLHGGMTDTQAMTQSEKHARALAVMRESLGFSIARTNSVIPSGGLGVSVTEGKVPVCCVTSLYSGLVYQPHDPIFFQSIGNPFIFRCADGVLIDGNDKGLSKSLYKSCRGRDSCWPLAACDDSWLTATPACPLNVGQYVNNHTKKYPANVAYQEFSLPLDFPMHLRQYLPNNHYASILSVPSGLERSLKIVALVSLKQIKSGEELFSSYFTVIS